MKIIGNYVTHTRSATSDYTRYLQISSFILYLLIINIPFNFKIMSYKTSSRVFIWHKKKCYTHDYIKHHLPRQMIPDILDITLHFVSYLYLLIINIRFLLSKLWHIKREAGYLFCTGKNGMSIIISSISCQVR